MHTLPCVKQPAGSCCTAQGAQRGALWRPRGVGWWGSKSKGWEYTYNWCTLSYSRNQHNVVNQSSSNWKQFFKRQIFVTLYIYTMIIFFLCLFNSFFQHNFECQVRPKHCPEGRNESNYVLLPVFLSVHCLLEKFSVISSKRNVIHVSRLAQSNTWPLLSISYRQAPK